MEPQAVTWPEPVAQDTPDWWPYASEFPHWQVWRGNSGLLYARRIRPNPQSLVRGEDAVDLRDQIRRADILG
jgi:hypothetical protein